MAQINVLVIEDEAIVSKDIQYSLNKLGYNVVGTAKTGELGLELIEEKIPDIVLMDIMLKGKLDGIQTADIVRSEFHIPVIFLTAYADDATILKAKISEPYGYLIKPFKDIDLRTSIEMGLYKHKKEREVEQQRDLLFSLVESKDKTPNFIFVKANSRFVKLNMNDIYFVEALKDYVVIHTAEKRYTVHSTMKEIETKLGAVDFMRVHRSFIVRLDKIEAIDFPEVLLENGKKTIPIGGSYREELSARIKMI